jgi:pyrroloquinoline quinone biosynthesis protein B
MVLGSGQDGGIPHTGCYCRTCNRARRYRKYRRLGPSIALADANTGTCYLIDASPDFKLQLDMVRRELVGADRLNTGEDTRTWELSAGDGLDSKAVGRRPEHIAKPVARRGRPGWEPGGEADRKTPVSGILLTHAHFGHCAGLWHLGKETLNERALPVYVTRAMGRFLKASHPFGRLVRDKNIEIRFVHPDKELQLGGLRFVPIAVPHRNEVADTVAYAVRTATKGAKGRVGAAHSRAKRVVYVPDVDRWTRRIVDEIAASDIALIDGTFYSLGEVSNFEEVRHPPIEETVELLKGLRTEIWFTHINHTNPVNKPDRRRRRLEGMGFKVAHDGLTFEI